MREAKRVQKSGDDKNDRDAVIRNKRKMQTKRCYVSLLLAHGTAETQQQAIPNIQVKRFNRNEEGRYTPE